jgi:hypothetical protein
MKNFEFNIQDILPNSLNYTSSIQRIVYLDKEAKLGQFEHGTKKHLNTIDLGTKVPLQRFKVLDSITEPKTKRIYVLTDKWNLEVWDLMQQKSVPLQRVRVFQPTADTQQLVDKCY